MIVNADSLETLRTRTSAKWASFPADVLPLPIAEMDYPLAEPIANVLLDAIRRSDTGYAPPTSDLPAAFAAFAQTSWGWTVDPAQVFATTDVGVAIVETLRQATTAGDGVIVTSPVYFPFYSLLPEAGNTVVDVPLLGNLDDGWSLDLPGIEAAFAAGATALLLCNPHNPVGLVHTAEQLSTLATIAKKYDATVVSDEIHAPLTYPGVDFIPFLNLSDDARAVGVCITSASKAWNLAGLKTALIVTAGGRPASIVANIPDKVYSRISILGLHATVAAFRHCTKWLDSVMVSLDQSRQLLRDLLAEKLPEVRYRMPDATYLAWLDCSALGWGDNPAGYALEHAKVGLSTGPDFGDAGIGFVRLNLACSPEVLTEAVNRLAAARKP